MGESARQLARDYLEAFMKGFATILGNVKIPPLKTDEEKLCFIDQVTDQLIQAHNNISNTLRLMDELTALRVKAARKIREHLTLVRGLCEGEIPRQQLELFKHHSLSNLYYSEELVQEALDLIAELQRPERKPVKDEIIRVMASDFNIIKNRMNEIKKLLEPLKQKIREIE